jgi:hypothetical protein
MNKKKAEKVAKKAVERHGEGLAKAQKLWMRKNLVKASDDLPPPAPDYSQPQGNPGESKSQEKLRRADFEGSHPSPPDVGPSAPQIGDMLGDLSHDEAIAEHNSRMNAAAVAALGNVGNPNLVNHDRGASPAAVAANAGQPYPTSLADLVFAGMATGRRR